MARLMPFIPKPQSTQMRSYWTSHVKDGAAILAFERLSQNAKTVKKEVDRSRSRNSIEQGKIYSRALKPDSLFSSAFSGFTISIMPRIMSFIEYKTMTRPKHPYADVLSPLIWPYVASPICSKLRTKSCTIRGGFCNHNRTLGDYKVDKPQGDQR